MGQSHFQFLEKSVRYSKKVAMEWQTGIVGAAYGCIVGELILDICRSRSFHTKTLGQTGIGQCELASRITLDTADRLAGGTLR